jgi:hypothetical protein
MERPNKKTSHDEFHKELKNFEKVWNKFYWHLPCDCYEFSMYFEIIQNIRNDNFNFNRTIFIDLIYDMLIVIYHIKDIGVDEEHYNSDKEYSDPDMEICYRVRKFL